MVPALWNIKLMIDYLLQNFKSNYFERNFCQCALQKYVQHLPN